MRRESKEGWERQREKSERSELLLAVSVLQIKMRIEVDEDLLTRFRGGNHPYALLGRWVGAGIARGGQVVRGVHLYAPPAFIYTAKKARKLFS